MTSYTDNVARNQSYKRAGKYSPELEKHNPAPKTDLKPENQPRCKKGIHLLLASG